MKYITITLVVGVGDGASAGDFDFDQVKGLSFSEEIQFFGVEDGITDHAVLLGAERNPGEQSINEFCSGFPQRRYSHEAKGKRLLFPRTGLVMVPYSQVNGGWHCVVVKGNKTYPVGGYDLFVSDIEITTALEVE